MRLFSLLAAFVLALASGALAAAPPARFPQPEFENGYTAPLTQVPAPRGLALEYADVAVLAAALAAAAWLALRRRSRAGLVALAVFAIAYFGFFRRGCVCPIGAIQNVAESIANPGRLIPWTVAAFFLLPLVFAAFFGRVFCASVCPLGALQELLHWRPVRVPAALDATLRMAPPVYLGLAVLLAATGADYIICRFDPFIGLYRLGGPASMLVAGGCLLALGLFVARPYCRYLCPYGVLLGWLSRFAFRHATIAPDGCINCRLCEQACPVDAIRAPEEGTPDEPRPVARRRLARMLALAPLLALLGAGLGWGARDALARLHPRVRLAEAVALERQGKPAELPLERETFRGSGIPASELDAEAARLRRQFHGGAPLLGGFLGLLLGARLAALACRSRREAHDMDHEGCVSCGRCFGACSLDRAPQAGDAA